MGQKEKKKAALTAEAQEKLNRELELGLYTGTPEDMRALLDRGADPNHYLPDFHKKDESPAEKAHREARGRAGSLHIAARAGRADIVALLIEYGAQVDTPKLKGCTPLNYAAANGHAEAVRVLLEHGADPENVDWEGMTPLMDGVRSGKDDVFELLLPLTKNLDQQENLGNSWHGQGQVDYSGDSAILLAASRGQLDRVRQLHQRGASMTLRGRRELNALHQAAFTDNADLVRYILEQAPELADQGDYRGGLPLHKAIMMRKDENFELLLHATQNLEAREKAEHPEDGDETGNTPLLAACWGRGEWVEALHKQGADLTATGIGGKNALHVAAESSDIAAMRYILHHAPELAEMPDERGDTPVIEAARAKTSQALAELVRAGVSLEPSEKTKLSVMHAAVSAGQLENIALLTWLGFSIYSPEFNGVAPIGYARDDKEAEAARAVFNAIRLEGGVKRSRRNSIRHKNTAGGPGR